MGSRPGAGQQLAFDMDPREAPDAAECLYAAGFFDGEGCISLGPTGRTVRAQMVLGNTNLPVLEWLREHWGGQIYAKKDRIQRRPQWQWRLNESRTAVFLDDIGPFVKVKAPAIGNARAFLRLKLQRRPGARVTAAERADLLPFLEAHRALELDKRKPVAVTTHYEV